MTTRGPMKLHLFHGRKTPNEQLDDWGEEGPTIEVEAIHVTYGDHWRLKFADRREATKQTHLAKSKGWETMDDGWVWVFLTGGMFPHGGMFYGDWDVSA